MSYRDDHEALSGYHDDLARRLAELEAKAASLATVEAERTRLAAELARVKADLAYRTARRAPVRLDNLRVASPCKVPWDAMTGTDQQRDCAKCEKTVYNVSAMTREAAEEFLASRGPGGACVRFFRRFDGTILTADCPVGARKQRRKLAIAGAVLAGGAGVAWAAGGSATQGAVVVDVPVQEYEVGKMVIEPEPFMGEVAMPEDLHEVKGDIAAFPDDRQAPRTPPPHARHPSK